MENNLKSILYYTKAILFHIIKNIFVYHNFSIIYIQNNIGKTKFLYEMRNPFYALI